MKIRKGFISNSSSCTYIVAIPKGTEFPDCPKLNHLSKRQIGNLKRQFKKLMNQTRYRIYEKDNKAVFHRLTDIVLDNFYIEIIARMDNDGEIINLCNIWKDRKINLRTLLALDGANRLMEGSNVRKKRNR